MSYAQRVASLLLAAGLTLTSCGKGDETANSAAKDSSGQGPMSIDTTQPVKEVSVDSSHVLHLRPEVGETRRYHVSLLSTASMETTDSLLGGPSGKQSGRSLSDFIVKQTVRAVNPDSTVDISFWIESAKIDQQADTSHIVYSSTNAAQKSDLRFAHLTAIIGKELKAKLKNDGRPVDITGLDKVVEDVMKATPDSLRNDRVKGFRAQQLQSLMSQSVGKLVVLLPLRKVGKDSLWKEMSEDNIPVTREIMFPVSITSTELVRGFEERAGKVVAVLEASSVATPKKMVVEEGQAKASLNSFKAASKGVMRVEDKTGLLLHRTLNDQRGHVFVLESKQQPGRYYKTTQNSVENLVVEMLPN
jgi:hypothetical protein